MLAQFTKGRTAVFIDASNILYSQRTLGWRIDYRKLADYLDVELALDAFRCFDARPHRQGINRTGKIHTPTETAGGDRKGGEIQRAGQADPRGLTGRIVSDSRYKVNTLYLGIPAALRAAQAAFYFLEEMIQLQKCKRISMTGTNRKRKHMSGLTHLSVTSASSGGVHSA